MDTRHGFSACLPAFCYILGNIRLSKNENFYLQFDNFKFLIQIRENPNHILEYLICFMGLPSVNELISTCVLAAQQLAANFFQER
jgi:hypothetical protein